MGRTSAARRRLWTPAGGRLAVWLCTAAAPVNPDPTTAELGRLRPGLHWTVTVTLDTGGVPPEFGCLHDATATTVGAAGIPVINRVCAGTMRNLGYLGAPGAAHWPPAAPTRPRWEWYRPQGDEANVLRRGKDALAAHYQRGGLMVRPASRDYR